MSSKIKIEVGPKTAKILATVVTTLALIDGPDTMNDFKTTCVYDSSTESSHTIAEPVTIKINKRFSQKVAGQVARFIINHFESKEETATTTRRK